MPWNLIDLFTASDLIITEVRAAKLTAGLFEFEGRLVLTALGVVVFHCDIIVLKRFANSHFHESLDTHQDIMSILRVQQPRLSLLLQRIMIVAYQLFSLPIRKVLRYNIPIRATIFQYC